MLLLPVHWAITEIPDELNPFGIGIKRPTKMGIEIPRKRNAER
jgi:hypothetical protein